MEPDHPMTTSCYLSWTQQKVLYSNTLNLVTVLLVEVLFLSEAKLSAKIKPEIVAVMQYCYFDL